MDTTQNTQQDNGLQSAFNGSANKIIKDSELVSKLKALYKTELSFGEKIILNTVERPNTFIAAVISAIKRQRDISLNLEFRFAADDGSMGHYQDTKTGETYTNTGIMALERQENLRLSLTPKLTEKTWKLGEKAAEQCQDYTPLFKAGQLKPL